MTVERKRCKIVKRLCDCMRELDKIALLCSYCIYWLEVVLCTVCLFRNVTILKRNVVMPHRVCFSLERAVVMESAVRTARFVM